MHLNEFADPKVYTLSADDMAAVIEHLKNIWLRRGPKCPSGDIASHLNRLPVYEMTA